MTPCTRRISFVMRFARCSAHKAADDVKVHGVQLRVGRSKLHNPEPRTGRHHKARGVNPGERSRVMTRQRLAPERGGIIKPGV
jgi:hypothetical protein